MKKVSRRSSLQIRLKQATQLPTKNTWRAVVVALLVNRSLPTPEIRGSNPFISNFIYSKLNWKTFIEKMKIKKKEAENGPILKNHFEK